MNIGRDNSEVLKNFDLHIDYLINKRIKGNESLNYSILIDFINRIYEGKNVYAFSEILFMNELENYIHTNKDLFVHLFNKIKRKYGEYFNVLVSGEMGPFIKKLINEDIINVKGNLVIVNGSIRKTKEDANNRVKILYNRYDIIDNDFIFIDDTYAFGGTRDRINEYLEQFNSEIIDTYIFYLYKKKYADSDNVNYLRYLSNDDSIDILQIDKYIDFIDSIDLSKYKNTIYKNIRQEVINNMKDLVRVLKEIY